MSLKQDLIKLLANNKIEVKYTDVIINNYNTTGLNTIDLFFRYKEAKVFYLYTWYTKGNTVNAKLTIDNMNKLNASDLEKINHILFASKVLIEQEVKTIKDGQQQHIV